MRMIWDDIGSAKLSLLHCLQLYTFTLQYLTVSLVSLFSLKFCSFSLFLGFLDSCKVSWILVNFCTSVYLEKIGHRSPCIFTFCMVFIQVLFEFLGRGFPVYWHFVWFIQVLFEFLGRGLFEFLVCSSPYRRVLVFFWCESYLVCDSYLLVWELSPCVRVISLCESYLLVWELSPGVRVCLLWFGEYLSPVFGDCFGVWWLESVSHVSPLSCISCISWSRQVP